MTSLSHPMSKHRRCDGIYLTLRVLGLIADDLQEAIEGLNNGEEIELPDPDAVWTELVKILDLTGNDPEG
jgi:hypothetical protein